MLEKTILSDGVKVVIDAYDGRVDFYVMPVEDPIIDAAVRALSAPRPR